MSLFSSSLLFFVPLISIFCIVIQRLHILIALLSLEAIILGVTYIIIISALSMNLMEFFSALVILSFGACEARLGLACLVSIARSFGNDKLASSSLLWS